METKPEEFDTVWRELESIVFVHVGKHSFMAIDAEDLHKISDRKWSTTGGYAYRTARAYPKARYVHRILLNAPKDVDVDHINGVKLDNRKSNLRLCTHAENMRNRRHKNPIGIKDMGDGTFGVMFKGRSLGYYPSFGSACAAWNEEALKLNDEFRCLHESTSAGTRISTRVARSGFRGVYAADYGFSVYIKGKYIGHFKVAADAARRYDEVAIETFGDRAVLNFPKQKHPALASA